MLHVNKNFRGAHTPVHYIRTPGVRQESKGARAALSFEELCFVEFADALDQLGDKWPYLIVHPVATGETFSPHKIRVKKKLKTALCLLTLQ